MDSKTFIITTIITLVIAIFIFCFIFFCFTAAGRRVWNNYWHDVKKADENTNYESRKIVEDTCRAYIAQYKTDKQTYEQYIYSEDKEERSWAKQAQMRANKTANTYNEYFIKNNYIWKENIPDDLPRFLGPVE